MEAEGLPKAPKAQHARAAENLSSEDVSRGFFYGNVLTSRLTGPEMEALWARPFGP